MKKIVAIMGSPRKNKNTDVILSEILKTVDINKYEIKKIYLSDLNIKPCTSCYYCAKTGKCCIDDDMQNLYPLFDESDIVIMSSPLYFNSLSAISKTMIDRCQMFWSSKYKYGKASIDRNKERKGIFVSSAGSPYIKGQFQASIPVIDLFFKSINVKYTDNLFCSNTDLVPAHFRKDILNRAIEIGKNL
ncbi:flavodoxin family protein [Haloimpatiens sp. FM7315]|uniref:flavodoxin family protein n=1 Tax=Haloimpatiens sp. FM7315 TaxID=3298609 RepID=UPI00370B5E63